MTSIWILFLLFLAGCFFAVLSILGCLLFPDKLYYNIFGAIASLVTIVFTWFAITIPSPEIYPLDNEIPRDGYVSIQIISNDNLKIYYTIDGSDPKKGQIYTNEIILEKTATISARAKYFLWWSDIAKSNFEVIQPDNIIVY